MIKNLWVDQYQTPSEYEVFYIKCPLPIDGQLSIAHDLPSAHSHLYILWDEEHPDEPVGWYLAKVTSVLPDRIATVL